MEPSQRKVRVAFLVVSNRCLACSTASVGAAHRITGDTAARIRDRDPHTSVTIYTEPCTGQVSGKCAKGCFLREKPSAAADRRQTETTGLDETGESR